MAVSCLRASITCIPLVGGYFPYNQTFFSEMARQGEEEFNRIMDRCIDIQARIMGVLNRDVRNSLVRVHQASDPNSIESQLICISRMQSRIREAGIDRTLFDLALIPSINQLVREKEQLARSCIPLMKTKRSFATYQILRGAIAVAINVALLAVYETILIPLGFILAAYGVYEMLQGMWKRNDLNESIRLATTNNQAPSASFFNYNK